MAGILIIEDNADNRELMTYVLTAHGHDVTAVPDGEQAIELLDAVDFDLIICDVHLPRMDGYEIVRTIKAREHAALPVVAVTALAMVGDRERLLQAGFDAYIAKPIEPAQFVAQIEGCLDVERSGQPWR